MAHNDNRQHNFSVSFNDKEYAIFLEKVEASGSTKSKFAREVMLNGSAKNSKEFVDILKRDIKPIGRNLNSAYMAIKQNGCNPKTVAKLECILDEFERFFHNYLRMMD